MGRGEEGKGRGVKGPPGKILATGLARLIRTFYLSLCTPPILVDVSLVYCTYCLERTTVRCPGVQQNTLGTFKTVLRHLCTVNQRSNPPVPTDCPRFRFDCDKLTLCALYVFVLYCIVLYCIVLQCIALYSVSHQTCVHAKIWNCFNVIDLQRVNANGNRRRSGTYTDTRQIVGLLYCTVLYCTVLYGMVSYRIVSYCRSSRGFTQNSHN